MVLSDDGRVETAFLDKQSTEHSNMVLHQPENKHVFKAFDLTGKVAVVTGISSCIYTRSIHL